MSGLSNVKYWLRAKEYDPDDEELCRKILLAAKQSDHKLTEGELEALCRTG